MAHLTLNNSDFISGMSFATNDRVNELLASAAHRSVVLYPGAGSVNLTTADDSEKKQLMPPGDQKLLIFVIDGTWATAGKMLRRSPGLQSLPRICFTPPHPSRFRVRKQPSPQCFSTIEAIHHTINLLGESAGFDVSSRRHDALLTAFDWMVERQLSFLEEALERPRPDQYRRPRLRVRPFDSAL